ncbi:MAG: hypothetical protein H6737_10395 [Alphaproteobacteria bacterium]|nr:hypothetical protein [Alphaproteobacteria bacterium]
MNRWLRLPDQVEGWRLCGIQDGIAWLLGRPIGGQTLRLEARDPGSGRVLAAFEAPGRAGRGLVLGEVAIVTGRSPMDTTRAWARSGPRWEADGEVVAAGPEMLVLRERTLFWVVDPATGHGRRIEGVDPMSAFHLVSAAVSGRRARLCRPDATFDIDASGDALQVAVDAPVAGPVFGTPAGFVHPEAIERGRALRSRLDWGQGAQVLDGRVTHAVGNATHLLAATDDALHGLAIQILDPHGVVARCFPDSEVLVAHADARGLMATWRTGACWYAGGALTAVRFPESLRRTRMPSISAALWDGFPVVCTEGVLVPLAVGEVRAAAAPDGPLTFERYRAAAPTRLASTIAQALSIGGAELEAVALRWEHDRESRQRFRDAGFELAVTGWPPDLARDPHLLQLATNPDGSTWCAYLHPHAAHCPVVRFTADGTLIWVASSLSKALPDMGIESMSRIRASDRAPWWFTTLYGDDVREPDDDANRAAVQERALLRGFLEEGANADALLAFYAEHRWRYARDSLLRILTAGSA